MTYEEYQAYMAKYGFVSCPLTHEQFNIAVERGAEVYGVGCDVNAGVDFNVAVKVNMNHAPRECFDCDGGKDDCHMNCGPSTKPSDCNP